MSNSLAVATVTAALQDVIFTSLQSGVDSIASVTVTLGRPTADGLKSKVGGVNLFLYQVTPNCALRNNHLPARRSDGSNVQRVQTAIDLHYLLTFFGPDASCVPQRLLGSTLAALGAQPVLSRAIITKVMASTQFPFLKQSNLADAHECVRITPEPLPLDEMSKLWSTFQQTSYHLSVAYRASVILLDREESVAPSLPVRTRAIHPLTLPPPVIERVRAADDGPITSTSDLVITGVNLAGETTRLVIDGGEPIVVDPADVRDDELRLVLSVLAPPLPAGVHVIQVAHLLLMGDPPLPHKGIESNSVPFVVRPRVNAVKLTTTGTPPATQIHLTFETAVGRSQRVVVMLHEQPPAVGKPRAYTFSIPTRPASDPPAALNVAVEITGVKPGTYFVRAQVDGADNALLAPGETYKTVVLP